ncbi:GT99 family glycosyltransferase N-terminal domain-containing protein [Serratia plymuthica]|uniref:GT99 family glycosyltransferase N-terminal domain-containing protein n=1 Tax=Serratia plymuthica TaxID=82996 RepID=UPI0014197470|nr:glycosyltransferase [Serratia plymuthica]NIC25163.1 glycosyltransferase [Serratia plymuthica]QPS89253.1 glycosyltransferase [Serratia plymuthica]
MISVFLPAYPFRGVKAPYLWFFYRVLTSIKEPVRFIMGGDYLSPLELWEKEHRWELEEDSQKRLGFRLPDLNDLEDNHKISLIDESFFGDYIEQCFNNPDELFKKFITEVIPELESEILSALNNADDIECILTWCNCPSLNSAAKKRNIRVVNLELGPLRSPEYLSTAYFDFSGVNGNTEAARRYHESCYNFNENTQIGDLRDFFTNGVATVHEAHQLTDEPAFEDKDGSDAVAAPADKAEEKFDVGIALQVENDSNIIAFSNSFNNQSLLDYADSTFAGKKLIRSHPGSRFSLQEGKDAIDHSVSSIAFITRCQHILTINSSVGLEAMLLDVPVTVLGDCSYAFCNVINQAERINRLAFYLFSYLVPFEFLFDVDYIRFRLSSPSEEEIIVKHVNYYITCGDGMRDADMEAKASSIIEDGSVERKIRTLMSTIQVLNSELTSKNVKLNELQEKIGMLETSMGTQSEIIVDVVVPVYAGLEETQECIESALATLPHWAQLVVINDASPEPELTQWLRERALTARMTLLENEQNLGFVATVNRGMKLNPKRDVLLLNSDVEVANDWLERIREAAYSRGRVGSITPFSNNATICSFPNFCEDNELFMGMNVQQLDDQFSTYGSENNLVEVPTGVGFCMYIRRDCLNEVGYFDVETFGRGYGEENDWCQRAAKAGWPNFHQLNVFVYHKGGVSFAGEQNPRKTRALELLNNLHPNYTKDVMDFIAQDPAKKARQQLLLRILAKKDISKVLLVSHKMGGGVTQHLRELATFYKEKVHFLLLTPEVEGRSVALSLNTDDAVYREKFIIDIAHGYDTLINLLRFIGVGHIHFHHLIGVADKIFDLKNSLSCTYDITIHDYYFVNANPTLTDKNGLFAGDEVAVRDRVCSEHYPIPEGLSAEQWRIKLAPWLDSAERIIFPSADTQVRFIRDFPNSAHKSVIAWHPDFEVDAPYPEANSAYQAGQRLKVLVLGAISREKGALMLDEVANDLKHEDIEFHLLGYAFRPLCDAVKCHGAYSSSDLQQKLDEIKPDVIWYPAQWPETYSYTLSVALEQGMPVVVPNIGAFGERVTGRQYSRVIAWDTSVKKMCEMWRSLRNDPKAFFGVGNAEALLDIAHARRTEDFYKHEYLQESWLRESELGRIDYKALIASVYSSVYVEVVPVAPAAPQGRKEKLLAILWKLSKHPALAWSVKLVPYRLQRYVKRFLSRRAIHEIIG